MNGYPKEWRAVGNICYYSHKNIMGNWKCINISIQTMKLNIYYLYDCYFKYDRQHLEKLEEIFYKRSLVHKGGLREVVVAWAMDATLAPKVGVGMAIREGEV